MVEVAARDLRNRTAEVLRRVQAGDNVTITVHGHAVAQLVPIVAEGRWLPAHEFTGRLREYQADVGLRRDLKALIDETTDDLPDPWDT